MADRMLTESNMDKAEALFEFAASRGHTLLELAFSWLAQQPAVSSVIAGATSVEQIESNVKATDWILTEEELAQIEDLLADIS